MKTLPGTKMLVSESTAPTTKTHTSRSLVEAVQESRRQYVPWVIRHMMKWVIEQHPNLSVAQLSAKLAVDPTFQKLNNEMKALGLTAADVLPTKSVQSRQETGMFAGVPAAQRPHLKARFQNRLHQLLSPMELAHYAKTGTLPTGTQARIEEDDLINNILAEVERYRRLY